MGDTPKIKPVPGAGGGPQPEFGMEKRLLLAFGLMGLVLFLTPYIYKPTPAPKQPVVPPAQPAATPAEKPAAVEPKTKPAAPAAAQSAQKEERTIVETDLYRIEFSNLGAVVRSWVLKKYSDSAGKPVDLINAAAVAKTGAAFQLLFPDQKPSVDLNQALYVMLPLSGAPGVEFEFSDGKLTSRKSFRFGKDTYLAQISSEVSLDGAPVRHLLTWRGGFGDHSVYNAAGVQHSLYHDLAQNKLVVHEPSEAAENPVIESGSYSFAGLEDVYFAAVFLAPPGTTTEIRTLADALPPKPGEKDTPHIGAAVGGSGSNRMGLFVGPKDIDLLKRVDPKLDQLVDFGWFALLAKPLFAALHWTNDRYVHNYGWSIVVITIAINFLLFPLKLTSLKSMKKMQVLAPQIAAINEKYKGLKLNDPRKQEQNREVMDLYKKHGANPMGGCVPMLLQIPFFFAFYKVLSVSIEMRNAGWLWVTDLSQPESIPIRILPLAMLGTQFVLQKMTPATTADPMQQKMMLFMPLILGFMFYQVQSGLVLYWLTGNIVGIAQQWAFNRFMPTPVAVAATAAKPPAKKKRP